MSARRGCVALGVLAREAFLTGCGSHQGKPGSSLTGAELPTVAEAGPLPGFEASSWFGLLAPTGTPPDIVNRLQQETAKALALPAVKERLLAQGAIPGGQSPAEFARQIESEIGKWAAVVKASGARVD